MQLSRTGRVNLFIAEAEYPLCLRVGELMTLQELNKAGPMTILKRMFTDGDWRVEDITNVLRLGLIGGGMRDQDAYALVERTVRSGSVRQYLPTATAVIHAALMGVDDEVIEEPDTGEAEAPAETPTPQG